MLDFTDMFMTTNGATSGGSTNRDRDLAARFAKKPATRAIPQMTSDENTNINANANPTASVDMIKDAMSDLTRSEVHELNMEKRHWQDQVSAIASENDSLRYQILTLQREKEKDAETIRSLRCEVSAAANKASAVLVEQRELRNHWAQEKNELESRMFQLTALQTQVEGTMKKKEKEYEKLQTLLQKAVKDSTRGAAKPGMVISKPVPKNSSQVKTVTAGMALLKDAETRALTQTISELTNENTSLRTALDGIQHNTAALKAQFDASVAQLTLKHQQDQEELLEQIAELQEAVASATAATVSEASAGAVKEEEVRSPVHKKPHSFVDANAAVTTTPAASSTPSAVNNTTTTEASQLLAANSSRKHARAIAFSPSTEGADADSMATRNNNNIDVCTPHARPVRFVVEQTMSELKQLSHSMNQTLMTELATDSATFFNDATTTPSHSHTQRSAMKSDISASAMKRGDVGKLRRMGEEVDRLKAELLSAMSTIHQQDQLIRQALLGQLPGLCTTSAVDVEDMEADQPTNTHLLHNGAASADAAAADNEAAAATNFMDDDDDFDLEDKFGLPPASPATRELLLSIGWSVPQHLNPSSAVKSRLSL